MSKRKLTGPLRWQRAIGEAEGLTSVEGAVLRALGDFLSYETWAAWPSVGTLARHAHTGESTVRRVLKRFEDRGVIERVPPRQRIAAGANRERITIQVRVDRLESIARDERAADQRGRAPPHGDGAGCLSDAEPCHAGTQTDHPSHQLNRSKEQTIGPVRETGGSDSRAMIREALRNVGVKGPNLDRCARLDLAPALVLAEIESIRTDRKVFSKPGALVFRLHQIAGVPYESKWAEINEKLPPDLARRWFNVKRNAARPDANEVK